METLTAAYWLVPPAKAVETAFKASVASTPPQDCRPRFNAMLDTYRWVYSGGGIAPISGQEMASTREAARMECDLGLYIVHYRCLPSQTIWRLMGYDTDPVTVRSRATSEWCWGVWRKLAWLLGDHPYAPPVPDTVRWRGGLPADVRAEVGIYVKARRP